MNLMVRSLDEQFLKESYSGLLVMPTREALRASVMINSGGEHFGYSTGFSKNNSFKVNEKLSS